MKGSTLMDKTFSPSKSKYIIIGLSVALVITTGLLIAKMQQPTKVAQETTEVPTVAKVSMTDKAFAPSTTSVLVGSAVTFVNDGAAPHQPQSDPYPAADKYPDMNAKDAVAPSDSFTVVMDKVGTFTYHDKLNPTITGTIEVRE